MNAHADKQLPNRSASKDAPDAPDTPGTPLAAAVSVSPAYAESRLARALGTSVLHEDAATRERARSRARKWRQVLSGIDSGSLTVGSRTPVAGLPAWVTPEVVTGGFATGSAAAGGPLLPYEEDAARSAGVPATRAELFAHFLTEDGLGRLWSLLDSGSYEVRVPEEAALATVAWLVRAGDFEAAAELVTVLRPFADRLRFLPRPTGRPRPAAGAVHRRTVGDAAASLARRRPNAAVETQREALTVWAPFEDALLTHRLEAASGTPGPHWHADGAALLARYGSLAAQHTRCTKHRNPKSNAAVLRRALEEELAGRALAPRLAGLLRVAVASMVTKRGTPGSGRHTHLRRVQAEQAALPSHHALAALVLRRISRLDPAGGTTDVDTPLAPVGGGESVESGLPVGTAVPPSIGNCVRVALSAPLEELVARGVVPSAEVLAELVPQLVAAVTAEQYADEPLRDLMAGTYRAFRNRRSLLLLDLAHQVRIEELPWLRAVSAHRDAAAGAQEQAEEALRRLGELAVSAFPATVLPNPLVRELSHLGRQAELGTPFVEELAADIFMGTFTPKFLVAARIAADLLEGSLYERYYDIDFARLRRMAVAQAVDSAGRGRPARTAEEFATLCTERAGTDGRDRRPAVNGKVIEQAQILTTHNLATLAARVGIAPAGGWAAPARDCFDVVCRLVNRTAGRPTLSTVKDTAYAWRQMLFHLSLCEDAERAAVLEWIEADIVRQPQLVRARLAPALAGLRLVAAGGSFAADGTAEHGRARRLLGWSTDGHWMRADRTSTQPPG
ncbi:hypothetical protein BCL76_11957 [Streptomyces sp. CG 926]|uniref:hypothetical protein n=1 Tax=Streptomyces sp. CG 926 TaxID=1882405 RepID=UPI000D7B891E|nr:hypothetical protein [Streptomyces sp. CG 926]PWK63631.1 hypothetical protein BCL76_11957 [Streptomyces sp. CG 926]